ncbi:hypothetical protein D3OALGA1CA_5787 [Olavius algarvensis associated proteobacterium Delta 3]|nr:hypothetical protein D3OALGB2SA_1212 [Olavius algarvensis associated proteobacterium Delta 3]CAB5171860.1 hypothetical protein D3OALGA1CA_5787 [Olavius algarvensis associated proteobacterium Delta 3]
MPKERFDPYGPFNYKVLFTIASGDTIHAGFSEVSGLNTEITYADYREGTEDKNRPRKIPLTYKSGEVTLKRGLIGREDLFKWTDAVRKGSQAAKATVTIHLYSEDRSKEEVVATWSLENARPSKWTGPTLTAAGGSDVAMEELTLVCDDISYE